MQNNKALLSTTVPDGMYYEITYNGDRRECYLDAYKKWENRCYKVEDTKDDLEPLREMGRLLREVGITEQSNALACYVLVGYEGDTLENAEERCREAMEAGAMPFAMLYRDESGRAPDKEWRRFQREWANRIIVGRKLKDYRNAHGRTEQADRQ